MDRLHQSRLVNVLAMAHQLILPSEATITTKFTPRYRAREFLGFLAVLDFVMTDEVRPTLAGECTVLLYTAIEWIARVMKVVSFMGDVVTMHVGGECAAQEAAPHSFGPLIWHADEEASHTKAVLRIIW